MPEFPVSEYPQLEGVSDGSEVKFKGRGVVRGDMVEVEDVEFETENHADKTFKQMAQREPVEQTQDLDDF